MLLSTLFSMADRALVVIKHECSLDQVGQRSVADICEDELEKGEYILSSCGVRCEGDEPMTLTGVAA